MLPRVNRIASSTSGVSSFGGINLVNGTPLGEWEELNNMEFSEYPALTNVKRPVRKWSRFIDHSLGYQATGGFLEKNGVYIFTVTNGIFFDDEKIDLSLSEGNKKLVSMGAYVIILPDWICINTATEPKEIIRLTGTEVTGTAYEYNSNQTYPTVSIFKKLYIDVAQNSKELEDFRPGDNVELSWSYGGKHFTRQFEIKTIAVEEYTDKGCVSVNFDTSGLDTLYWYLEDKKQGATFRIPRITDVVMRKIAVNDMEFVVEHNNRLWGCSSTKREIYCSKLGDPLSWGEYKGVSTDSWAVTVGSDGDFTGSAVYNDSVLFFKENCVHIVYGTKASNFTVNTINLRGVQKGSDRSLCISNGMLYYKAVDGIYYFNGSVSARADTRLGKDIAEPLVGVADDNMIVMAVADTPENQMLYIYDCVHDSWYTRDYFRNVNDYPICYGMNIDGELCLVSMMIGYIIVQSLSKNETENMGLSPEFALQTGELNRSGALMRYITKLRFVLGVNFTDELYDDPQYQPHVCYVLFRIKLSYDGGDWQTVYSFDSRTDTAPNTEIFTVPVIPRRCQRLKVRIEGQVNKVSTSVNVPYFKLYGIYCDTQGGTELG